MEGWICFHGQVDLFRWTTGAFHLEYTELTCMQVISGMAGIVGRGRFNMHVGYICQAYEEGRRWSGLVEFGGVGRILGGINTHAGYFWNGRDWGGFNMYAFI